MAAADYLRAASAQLRNGAGQLQQEASSLNADMERQKNQHNSDISHLESQITNQKAVESTASANNDNAQKQAAQQAQKQIQQQIQQHKQIMNDEQKNMTQMIQAKNDMATQLNNQAGQLESLASNPAAN